MLCRRRTDINAHVWVNQQVGYYATLRMDPAQGASRLPSDSETFMPTENKKDYVFRGVKGGITAKTIFPSSQLRNLEASAPGRSSNNDIVPD